MKLKELNYLIDNKYVTDVTFVDFYLNPDNAEALEKLTEKEMVDRKILTQTGYISNVHTIEINADPQDSKISINNVETNVMLLDHGSKVTWSVSKEGYDEQNGEIESLDDDKILNITLQQTVPAGPQSEVPTPEVKDTIESTVTSETTETTEVTPEQAPAVESSEAVEPAVEDVKTSKTTKSSKKLNSK